jgi:hypothetical protein
MARQRRDPEREAFWPNDYYLPLSHAARALCMMKQVTPCALFE